MRIIAKKIFILVVVCFAIFGMGIVEVFAGGHVANYDILLEVNQDSSIHVTETIIYNFGSEDRHGILRDIPLDYETDNGKYSVLIKNFEITNEDGIPYNTEIITDYAMHIKIGSEDVLVTGLTTYILKYDVEGSINFLKNFDEFYWNATSNFWKTSISKSSVTIVLPPKASEDNSTTKCYMGYYGRQILCDEPSVVSDEKTGLTRITYNVYGLRESEGISVVTGFSKKIIDEMTINQVAVRVILIIAGTFLYILLEFFIRKKNKLIK